MKKTDSFKSKTVKGLKWSVLNQISQFILSLISSIFLARLLNPQDFGLFGMIAVFTGFAMVFADFGFNSAIVQAKQIDNKLLSSVFWLNMAIGLLIMLFFWAGSSLIAEFYNENKLTKLIPLISINFVILPLGVIHSALLTKTIDFKTQFFIALISTVVSLTTAILLATNQYGVYALITQVLVLSSVRTILFWINVSWRPSFSFSMNSLKSLLNFSTYLFATKSIGYWTRNIDNLLIGKFLSSYSLGIYTKSYSLMMLPLNNISNIISRVMFPSFSLIQDDSKRIKAIYFKLTKTIALITFPLMSGLFITADVLIPFLFGEQWLDMVFVVQVLSLLAIPQSIGTLNGNLYMFKGRTDLQFRVSLIMNLIVILFLVIGVQYGLHGLVLCYAGGSLLILYHNFKYPLSLIETNFFELAKNLTPILLYSAVMIICVRIFHTFLLPLLSPNLTLFVDILIGICVYSGLVWKFDKHQLNTIIQTLREN